MPVKKPRILLHACCSSCSPYVLRELMREFKPVVFYYNPNIHPFEEYLRRRLDLEGYVRSLGIEFIEDEYDDDRWFYLTSGLEHLPEGGERCYICFRMRLNRTALYAAMNGFEWFATTLTVSSHKNSQVINKIGRELANDYGINFLNRDFKKRDGSKISVKMAKEFGFYRQNYCGCVYSYAEAEKKRRMKDEDKKYSIQIISPENNPYPKKKDEAL